MILGKQLAVPVSLLPDHPSFVGVLPRVYRQAAGSQFLARLTVLASSIVLAVRGGYDIAVVYFILFGRY